MTVKEYFGDWDKVVNLKDAHFMLHKIINQNVKLCPKLKDTYKAFRLCSLEDLKVVILGLDPYPQLKKNGEPVATGIAFANSNDTLLEFYSPSLRVLRNSFSDFTKPNNNSNFDPSLEKIARQGVLWLNTALSCQVGRTGSHALLWRPFIQSLLQNLSKSKTNIVYVLMGSYASSFDSFIDKENNCIIRCKHPSYYARINENMSSNIWNEVNNYLKLNNKETITWL